MPFSWPWDDIMNVLMWNFLTDNKRPKWAWYRSPGYCATGPFWYKIGPIPLRISHFHILLLLVTEANLPGLYIFTFETPQCKNHFATNFIKIHSGVTEILPVSCFVLFLVTADGGHLGLLKCKKSKSLHARTILTQIWSNSIEIFWFSHFSIFSNRGQYDWSYS